jgi:hypothetical protein
MTKCDSILIQCYEMITVRIFHLLLLASISINGALLEFRLYVPRSANFSHYFRQSLILSNRNGLKKILAQKGN